MSRTGRGAAAGLHATMLAFLTTDAAIEPALLKKHAREGSRPEF